MNTEVKVVDCEFKFKCPQRWEAMDKTAKDDVHFCGECQKLVYFAENPEKFAELKGSGECVAVWQNNAEPDLPPMVTAGIPMYDPADYEESPKIEGLVCEKCDLIYPIDSKFCGRCGTALINE